MTDSLTPYQARMQHKKRHIDACIKQAHTQQGVLVVLTGHGKGKSTSAFGMIARALGHHMQVGVIQFIKSREDIGEVRFFRHQPGVRWQVMGEGFSWETQDPVRDQACAEAAWDAAKLMLSDHSLGLVVLDELTYALKYGWLDINRVLVDLQQRPRMQHVVITGRMAPKALCDAADTLTELHNLKHAWQAGIQSQRGVDL